MEATLKMPSKYAIMDAEEMMYTDGGVNLGMSQAYLSKTICIQQAQGVIRTYHWNNVTGDELAKEIYGHAVVYYRMAVLSKIPVLDTAVYAHVANGVDVDNAVDRYQWAWNLIWNL